jgi:hypothetical protein
METAEMPLLILGWCSILYGVIELINALKIYRIRKEADRQRTELEAPIAEEISSELGTETPPADTTSVEIVEES